MQGFCKFQSFSLIFTIFTFVSHLLGIDSPEHLAIHASRGAIFEGFVITEIIKHFYVKGQRPALYYWREHSGTEVDVLLYGGEINQQIAGVEIISWRLLGAAL